MARYRYGYAPPRPERSWEYRKNAALIRATGTHCWICGGTFTADDPCVADHVLPRGLGGSSRLENLRPAHRSCNGKRGARLVGDPDLYRDYSGGR
jgi:5-methylcytosine-specific restriction endonuclease McrA